MSAEFNLNNILRENIAKLKPYTSARDEYSGEGEVFLDANENPLGSATQHHHNRYPDPLQIDLKTEISKIKNVPVEQIFLGNGSDEAIDLVFRAFCNPGKDNVITVPPTYGMYQVLADINDVEVKQVSLTEDYQLDVDGILGAVTENTKVIFICTPNNPTGNSIKSEDIFKILDNFNGIVFVDEAYIDFTSAPSFTNELKNYPNLVVIQTFSKAWGLAAIRLGMAYASEEIIGIFNKVKFPYNISDVTQEAAMEAVKNVAKTEKMVKEVLAQRDVLENELKQLADVEKVYPTDANFLLVKIKEAHQKYNDLIAQKIIVRDRSKVLLCEDSLRITIGTAEENTRLINALKTL